MAADLVAANAGPSGGGLPFGISRRSSWWLWRASASATASGRFNLHPLPTSQAQPSPAKQTTNVASTFRVRLGFTIELGRGAPAVSQIRNFLGLVRGSMHAREKKERKICLEC
jgi:hypothetical protein